MTVDEIIHEIKITNDCLSSFHERYIRAISEVKGVEQTIKFHKKRKANLMAQLRELMCCQPGEKQTDEELQTDDTPQTDDTIYSIVRRHMQIDCVRWAKDVERVLEVTVLDDETHKAIELFTDNEPCIKACIYGLGESVDIKYDEKSGELLEMIVGE